MLLVRQKTIKQIWVLLGEMIIRRNQFFCQMRMMSSSFLTKQCLYRPAFDFCVMPGKIILHHNSLCNCYSAVHSRLLSVRKWMSTMCTWHVSTLQWTYRMFSVFSGLHHACWCRFKVWCVFHCANTHWFWHWHSGKLLHYNNL